MRRCGACEAEYPDSVAICPRDGQTLADKGGSGARARPEREPVFDPSEFDDADETVSIRSPRADETVSLRGQPRGDETIPFRPQRSAGTPRDAGRAETKLATPAPPPAAAPARATHEIAMPSETLEPGTQVGEYQVAKQIDAGGMATVYAGVHPLIGKEVAIKVLSGALSSDPVMVQRFVQEARAVNQIRHHNIVDIFALGQLADGRTYCVMELLSGQTLHARLRGGARLNYEDALSILSQMCDGLEAAHARQIVHRDLKPDNVFLVDTGRGLLVKLLDFGIAKLLTDESGGRARTRAGILMGTPEYMAPEQCLGQEVDTRSDIYALGVIMYEMFTGRLPFEASSALQMITAQVSTDVPDPRESGVPDDLAAIILDCLAKEPASRPQSVGAVRARLVQVLQRMGVDVVRATELPAAVTGAASSSGSGRGPVATPRPPAASKTGETRRRRRLGLIAGAIAVAGLAAVGAVVVFKEVRTRAEKELRGPSAAETTEPELPGAQRVIDAGTSAIAPRQDPALPIPAGMERPEEPTRPRPRTPTPKPQPAATLDAGPTAAPAETADAGPPAEAPKPEPKPKPKAEPKGKTKKAEPRPKPEPGPDAGA